MGIPSFSIYANELFRDYGVKRAIRVGTAGSMREDVKLRDLVLAMSACTDSAVNRNRFNGRDFAPAANFGLLKTACEVAMAKGWNPLVGSILSSDMFYGESDDEWKLRAKFGVIAVEMECAELYTPAAKYGREALTILTISDSLVSHELTSAGDRQKTFTRMMEAALDTAVS
jgi:purine-nucleoside phosphorylase